MPTPNPSLKREGGIVIAVKRLSIDYIKGGLANCLMAVRIGCPDGYLPAHAYRGIPC